MILYCHKKAVFPGICRKCIRKKLHQFFITAALYLLLLSPAPKGPFQQWEAVKILLLIINILRIRSKICNVTLCLCQKSPRDQLLQIDKIRIPGKCAKGLIGRIPISGRPQRQDLPVTLSRLCQLVHKRICLL